MHQHIVTDGAKQFLSPKLKLLLIYGWGLLQHCHHPSHLVLIPATWKNYLVFQLSPAACQSVPESLQFSIINILNEGV